MIAAFIVVTVLVALCILWLTFEVRRAPTLDHIDAGSGYRHAEQAQAQILDFPTRLRVVQDAVDSAGDDAERVWPVPIESARERRSGGTWSW